MKWSLGGAYDVDRVDLESWMQECFREDFYRAYIHLLEKRKKQD